jgi:RNA polymerase sigma-70 factor (ECF subfamily)
VSGKAQKIGAVRALTGVEATVREEAVGRDAASKETAPDVAEVFDAHGAFVSRALRCLGVADRDLADACQEVFIVVARKLAEFEGRAALRTWLYAICVRQAMRVRRTTARRREDAVAEPPAPHGSTSTQEDEVEQRRRLAAALRILDRLDDAKRTVFVLYEVEQLPMSEVAEVVGCPLQTAYSRLYAARRQIAQHLARPRGAAKEKR